MACKAGEVSPPTASARVSHCSPSPRWPRFIQNQDRLLASSIAVFGWSRLSKHHSSAERRLACFELQPRQPPCLLRALELRLRPFGKCDVELEMSIARSLRLAHACETIAPVLANSLEAAIAPLSAGLGVDVDQ